MVGSSNQELLEITLWIKVIKYPPHEFRPGQNGDYVADDISTAFSWMEVVV